ncbi:mas-related G-protein coupled receptor member A-like [Dromiciops gliroides]|uniref:mas-related G-protein coupled receptor member A-like n=1 Tax=Dromiciops gliroides TaxID=33562 RepID=UPI001CC4F446|nr:mas-related G-protein coupled receptor member A-like [Dromiciops gliroides]
MTMDQTSMLCSWELDDVNETQRNGTIVAPSQGDRTDAKSLPIIIPYLTVLMSLVGLVGNGIVLWLLGFRIKRNPFSVYILNRAGADALFLCCQVFYTTVDIFKDSYDTLSSSAHFHVSWSLYSSFPTLKVLVPLTFSSYTMDLSLLAAISTERCLSVLFPVWYRGQRPRHASTLVCALLWTESVLLSVLTGHSCGFLYRECSEQACYDFTIAGAVLVFSLLSLMCLSALTLFLRVQGSAQKRQSPKIYVAILSTVFTFLLLGLPFSIYWFLLSWWKHISLRGWYLPYFIIDILSCVNSGINPFIYFFVGSFRRQKSREPLKVVLQRALMDEAELRERGETSQRSQKFQLEIAKGEQRDVEK